MEMNKLRNVLRNKEEEERGRRGGGVREVEMEGDRGVRRETASTAQLSAFCQEEVRDRNVPNLHSLSPLFPLSLLSRPPPPTPLTPS